MITTLQTQQRASVPYSQFRAIAQLTVSLRHAASNQQTTIFNHQVVLDFEEEQGGQLDLSFEDVPAQNNEEQIEVSENSQQEEEKTMSSDSNLAEGRELAYGGFEMQSDFGFDTTEMFGQLKRKTPLIKPEL